MFVGPFVHRGRVSLVTINYPPAIFSRPFRQFVVFSVRHRRDRNVTQSANGHLRTLFFIRPRNDSRRQYVVVVIRIRRSSLQIRRFTRVTQRVRRYTILR